jgi:micrococcal nuclease
MWSLAALAYVMAMAAVSPTVRQRLGVHRESAPPDGELALVTGVVDGDTIAVDPGGPVRVLGLDAPETGNPHMEGAQPLGQAASSRLSEIAHGRTVVLERDVTDRDHYGRRLRHVWCDERLVAEVLIGEGLAHAMSIPPNTRYSARLRAAEDDARSRGVGLWGLPRPTELPVFAGSGP